MSSTDEIMVKMGGFGRFQWMVMMVIFGPLMLMGWSMLLMSFAGTAPDFWCVKMTDASNEITGGDYSYQLNNMTLELCPPADNRTCRFVYSEEMNTIINEWDLVCDDNKIAPFVTAIQMFGVLVGAFCSGQAADTLGRKPIFFLSLFLLGMSNMVAAFSVSWRMFAAMRFFIGTAIGSLFVVCYPYFMEFLTPDWRPLIVVVPFWTVGTSTMALACWLLPHWSYQHIIVACLHVPFLLGWFVVPESLHYLAVKDRIDEAEKVVEQMCRYNRKEKPDNTRALLQKIAEEEKRKTEGSKKYTYIDLYRHWTICWQTLLIQFTWILMTMVYYGIAFGAAKLSGNLYLNIFLLGVVSLPTLIPVFYLTNKIGRRWTAFLFFGIAALGSLGVIIVTRTMAEEDQGIYINVLALLISVGVGSGWGAFQVMSTEIYPTVVRNLGVGAANTAARIGGIIAPYIFAMDGEDVMIPFIIVGSAMAVCAGSALVFPETKLKPLAESMEGKGTESMESKGTETEQGTEEKHSGPGSDDSATDEKKKSSLDANDIIYTKL